MTEKSDVQPAVADTEQKWAEHSNQDAQAANITEHQMTVRQAIRTYRWGIVWSLTVSMSIIMEGYDTILMGSFLGYPAFQEKFGVPHSKNLESTTSSTHEVPAHWQSALWAGSIAGAIVGVHMNGYLIKHFGYKKVFFGSLVLMTAFIFPSFFGMTVEVQTVGQVLCGVPWGIFATIGPAYASEILPLALRSYLTAYVNMCFCIGQFIAAGVLQGLVSRTDEWSYRIPFAIQWIWPVPLMIACFFMPESPWWLIRNGRHEEAEAVLRRVTSGPEQQNSHKTLAMMVHTDKLEQEIEQGSSYSDCFKGSNLRRTEIACISFAGQVLAGSQFAFSATYFLIQAGMTAENAYKMGLGGTAIAFVGTVLSWVLMRHFGRRQIYLVGLSFICVYLFIIGVLTTAEQNKNVVWAQAALCIIWLLTFSLSLGPIGWAVPAEVSSTRLRSKTICLARNTYYVALLVANTIEPYMVNPTEWNWRGYTGLFWFGTAFITLVWAFFRLAETRGRTFEELDIMFEAKVPTRKFAKYRVDAYAEGLAIKDRVAAEGEVVDKQ